MFRVALIGQCPAGPGNPTALLWKCRGTAHDLQARLTINADNSRGDQTCLIRGDGQICVRTSQVTNSDVNIVQT